MKHFSSLAFLMGMFFVAMVAVGCDDDEEKVSSTTPVVSMSAGTPTENSVDITLTTTGISSYAYICVEDTTTDVYDDEAILFRSGTTGTLTDGTTTVTLYPLSALTSYIVYFAFTTTDGSYYGEVLSTEFTTTDYTTEGLALVAVTGDGFTMHIKVPQSTIDADNAIRYTYRQIAYDTVLGGDEYISSDLMTNGQAYATSDVTIVVNNDNMYDDDDEFLHDPIVPGEPIYFYAGEYAWGDAPYANWADGYWTEQFTSNGGYYERFLFRTQMPTELNASFNASVTEISSTEAYIIVEPDDEILSWSIMVVDADSYHAYVLPYLDNNEDYVQWFVTSWYANYLTWAASYSSSGYLEASELNITDQGLGLEPETTYYVFLVGYGDSDGLTQTFETLEFTTTEKTLDAPEVVVTALDADPTTGESSPYEAWFNIKAPNGDVASASYLAEYSSAWRGYTPSELMSSYGTAFSDTEVAAINSSDGYNVYFASRAGSTTRLAVLAYNSESTTNSDDLDSDNPSCVADCTTPEAEAKTRVNSTLFEDLEGDWTMTLTSTASTTYTKKVSIAQSIDYTEKADDSIYSIYSSYSTAWVDSLWNDYVDACSYFNEHILYNQNRLLCTGFCGFNTASPYELFTSSSYSAYDCEEVIYDFGPKWYLEVIDENTISMPINYIRQLPATAWGTYTYYMLGGYGMNTDFVAYGDDYDDVYFDVTISDDKNTITISPISNTYYPNLFTLSSGYVLTFSGVICSSDIVLTRGYTETTSVASESEETVGDMTGMKSKHRRTTIVGTPQVKEYNNISVNVVNKDRAEVGLEKLRQHYAERTAKLNTK